MTKRRPLIAGNWKMNGLRADAEKLAEEIASFYSSKKEAGYDLLVCPPYTVMETVYNKLEGSGVLLGAQNCHVSEKGAHTGDISPAMLKDAGCSHVIVGHSERRSDHGETDIDVKAQAKAAQSNGLLAIICVGETESDRESGNALNVVREQVRKSAPETSKAMDTVIAYEPVWAIGTGKVATPDDVQEMHKDIRTTLSELLGQEKAGGIRIIYGGSMKPDNAKELLALADVDGGLIGGASLIAQSFEEITKSC